MRYLLLLLALCSLGASYRTDNFVVSAPTGELAEQICRHAENYRKELAVEWLGEELRTWAQPCQVTVNVSPQLGAGGQTDFKFTGREVHDWRMKVQGSYERILDSVMPHEILHTIFASHFRQPLPRWADEGACTTIEHVSERNKQQAMLIEFLRTNRGIPFSTMFAIMDYPRDMMPLYAQGTSLSQFLIAHKGRQGFVQFLNSGLESENWEQAVAEHFDIDTLGELQAKWLSWVRAGSPKLDTSEHAAMRPTCVWNGSRWVCGQQQVIQAAPQQPPAQPPMVAVPRQPAIPNAIQSQPKACNCKAQLDANCDSMETLTKALNSHADDLSKIKAKIAAFEASIEAGQVSGKDGKDGKDGKNAEPVDYAKLGDTLIAKLPPIQIEIIGRDGAVVSSEFVKLGGKLRLEPIYFEQYDVDGNKKDSDTIPLGGTLRIQEQFSERTVK